MRKYILLIPFIFLTLTNIYSQNNECDKIRNLKIINISVNDTSAVSDAYHVIKRCLNLDSVDVLIFNEVSFATMVVGMSNETEALTYGSIMDMIQRVKQSDFYEQTRKSIKFHHDYFEKKISKKDSAAISEGFLILDQSINTDSLISFIYSPKNTGLSYNQAYLKYLNKQNEIVEEKYQANEKDYNEIFDEFKDYKSALERANIENKHIILYFTSYGDIHGRKFEAEILHELQTIDQIKNHFLFFPLFVDEKEKLTNTVEKVISPLKFNNKGQYYTYLQHKIINDDRQTTIAILNPEGEVLYHNLVSQLTEKELLEVLNQYSPASK